MKFNHNLLDAIGAWQRGWNEVQSQRMVLAEKLRQEAEGLDEAFRSCAKTCYRKRFLLKGELCEILMADCKDEGITSWTTDLGYAEGFKGLLRPDAVVGAIFEHKPQPGEVVVNIESLWSCSEFAQSVEGFADKESANWKALKNFQSKQSEVVLKVPLKGSEIVALVGISSSFDELCNQLELNESQRCELFKNAVDNSIPIGQPIYTHREGAQNVIASTIKRMWEIVEEARQQKPT
jgi:hypothetical protein